MSIEFKIYLLGLVIIPLIWLVLNRYFKWMTREDVGYSDDHSVIIIWLFLWPLVIFLATVVGLGWLILKGFHYSLPKSKKRI